MDPTNNKKLQELTNALRKQGLTAETRRQIRKAHAAITAKPQATATAHDKEDQSAEAVREAKIAATRRPVPESAETAREKMIDRYGTAGKSYPGLNPHDAKKIDARNLPIETYPKGDPRR